MLPLPTHKTLLSGVLLRLLQELKLAGILTEDLCVPGPKDRDDLEAVYRGLCRLPSVPNSCRRRIDFLTVPWESKGAALLYYTVRPASRPSVLPSDPLFFLLVVQGDDIVSAANPSSTFLGPLSDVGLDSSIGRCA